MWTGGALQGHHTGAQLLSNVAIIVFLKCDIYEKRINLAKFRRAGKVQVTNKI